MAVVRVALAMGLSTLLSLLIQLWDRRRLRARGLDAPWGIATWGLSLLTFGPLSLLAWAFLTRERPWRWMTGPLWTTTVSIVILLISGDGKGGNALNCASASRSSPS